MPAFLVALIVPILEWLASKGFTFWLKERAQKAADDKIDQSTQREADNLKGAQTDGEFEKSAEDILSGK